MVFEDFLTKAVKRKVYSLVLGILYVFVAYGTSKIIFPNDVSIAMIILTSLLFVPSISRFLSAEEKIERRDGTRNFLRDHKTLLEIFIFLFIGILTGYLLVGSFAVESTTYQNKILSEQHAFSENTELSNTNKVLGITINNIEVIIVAFVVSLFYGAGAFFLLVRTASVFAAFVLGFSEIIAKNTLMTATLLSVHFIPEIFGFILAAFAGGVVSKAIVKERIGTAPFRNVVKDSTILLLLSVIFVVLAAVIEVYITPGLANASFLG